MSSASSQEDQRIAALEMEIKTLRDIINNKKAELEKFAQVVSHDIKTPVSNILLSTQLLTEDYADELDSTANNLLDILKRASQKIKDLVEGMLSYYKSDSALAQEAEEINLQSFFEAVTDMLSHHNEATIQYPADATYIHAKRTALEQIFTGLLNNAIKYNDNENADIAITFKGDAHMYSFTVSDNGRGIDEKNHDKIFALFTNLGTKDRFGNTGTGIGLCIVKKLVESQGGTIALHPNNEKGTVFEFTLKRSED